MLVCGSFLHVELGTLIAIFSLLSHSDAVGLGSPVKCLPPELELWQAVLHSITMKWTVSFCVISNAIYRAVAITLACNN